jgi:beta-lysine 5,6-aminomutase beta subunit
MATDLGVDKIFTRGTTPAEVASYLVQALVPAAATSAVPA